MGKYLHLRKYGKIRYRTSKKYTNTLNSTNIKINNVTISQENGKYYASINIECEQEEMKYTGKNIAFDINSNKNSWLVSNNGQKEKFNIDHENQMIKYLNQQLSLKKPNSRAYKKIQKRLWKYYNKRTNKLRLWKYYNKRTNKLNDHVRHDGSVAHPVSEMPILLDFNPSCDGISSLETLNQVIGYEVA